MPATSGAGKRLHEHERRPRASAWRWLSGRNPRARRTARLGGHHGRRASWGRERPTASLSRPAAADPHHYRSIAPDDREVLAGSDSPRPRAGSAPHGRPPLAVRVIQHPQARAGASEPAPPGWPCRRPARRGGWPLQAHRVRDQVAEGREPFPFPPVPAPVGDDHVGADDGVSAACAGPDRAAAGSARPDEGTRRSPPRSSCARG